MIFNTDRLNITYHNILCWFQTTLYTRVLVYATKRQKKYPFWVARFSIKIWFKQKQISPLYPAPIQFCSGEFSKNPNVDGETYTTVFSFLLVWFRPPKNIYHFVELSFICFVLVHTQVRQTRNYYIIIYTTKNYHFTCTYFLNYLIGLS